MDPMKLLVIGGAFAIGALSLIVTMVLTWILSRQKEKALEALKAYAEQGREPPPELLKAIAGDSEWKAAWGLGGDMGGSGGGRWSNALTFGGIALGFGIGAVYTQAPITDPFWIVSIVCGVLALASLAQALFANRAK